MAEQSGLEFRILGDLEVWRGGRRLDIGSPRQRELLALLLLHRNRVVATDRLIDLMWGSRPPRTAANTLHVLVSGIRRSLNGDGAESVLITRRPGYELRTEPGQVDLERFEALRDTGLAAAARGDHEAASDSLRRALELWRGDPLPELWDVMDLAGELGRLRELRLAAVEARVDADLALGRHHEVVAELEAVVDAEPLRERPRAQLMLALYRSGRQARALEVYREGRRHLVDELGVEPGPALRELQMAILRQDTSVSNVPAERPRPKRRRRGFVAAGVGVVGVSMLTTVMVWHSDAPASRGAGPAGGATLIDGEGVRTSSALPGADAATAEPGGAVWVASASGGTITRVSASGSPSVAGVGGRPTDLAWGFGRVWVGDAPGRRVEAYDPKRRAVVLTVPLTNAIGPVGQPAAALTVGARSVWVDNGGLAGVWRINPASGRVVARIRNVQTGAIAFGMGSVWVAGDFFDSTRVDRIDPTRNVVVGSIRLPSGGPVSIAAADGRLWVACDNDTLWQVDVATRHVARVPTAGDPVSVSASGGAVWIAEADPNRVAELDPATGHASMTRLSGLPTAVVSAGGSAWVTTVPPLPAATGKAGPGVVTVALNTGIDSIDPAVAQWATTWQLEYATGLRLLNYPDRPGPAGDYVVPDAAAAMPQVSNGGRTHTFTVRRGLHFWPGDELVTAAAFRAAVERALSRRVNALFGYDFMSDLVGVRAYRTGRAAHVSGIRLLGRYRISFTTVKPNPAFDDYIAAPMYAAVPPGTPDVRATQPLPSAGPYYIATYIPQRLVVLRRNPGYRGPRPAVPSEIRYVLGQAGAEPAWKQVADGHADVDADPATPQQLASLRAGASRAKVHVRVDPAPVILYLLFNTRSPAVLDPRVRRAVSDAIDRAALAATIGPEGATPTDQYLVPSLVGYPGRDGHVYPLDHARPRAARRLLRATGVRLPLTLRLSTCDTPDCVDGGATARVSLLRSELGRIGIRLVVLGGSRSRQFNRDLSGGFDIADEGFGGFPTSDPAGLDYPIVTEARFGPTAVMKRADATPLPRRAKVWRALELALAHRAAPLAAYAVPNTITIASRRVGCLVYQLQFGLDLGELCPLS